MIIVLLEVSVTLLPKAIVGLGCLLKSCLQISECLQECITVDSFMFAKFFYFLKNIMNTNTWKLKRSPVDDMTDSNDTCILGCHIFENCFQYQMRNFLSKRVHLFKPWGIKVVNWVEDKYIRNFCIFNILRKNLITFQEGNFFKTLLYQKTTA